MILPLAFWYVGAKEICKFCRRKTDGEQLIADMSLTCMTTGIQMADQPHRVLLIYEQVMSFCRSLHELHSTDKFAGRRAAWQVHSVLWLTVLLWLRSLEPHNCCRLHRCSAGTTRSDALLFAMTPQAFTQLLMPAPHSQGRRPSPSPVMPVVMQLNDMSAYWAYVVLLQICIDFSGCMQEACRHRCRRLPFWH